MQTQGPCTSELSCLSRGALGVQGGVAPGQVSMAGVGLPVEREALTLGVDALLFSTVPTSPCDSPPGTCTPHISVCALRMFGSDSVTPQTVALQAPLFMGFPRHLALNHYGVLQVGAGCEGLCCLEMRVPHSMSSARTPPSSQGFEPRRWFGVN